jgi:hypothetical protein
VSGWRLVPGETPIDISGLKFNTKKVAAIDIMAHDL